MYKAIINQEEFDNLDEGIRSNYAALKGEEGLFVFQVEPVSINGKNFALENIAGLKSSLTQQTQWARQLEAKLKLFEGLDPDEAKLAIEKLSEIAEGGDRDDKEKFQQALEAAKAQIEQRYKSENEKIKKVTADTEEELKKFKVKYEKYRLNDELRSAALAEGADPEKLDELLMPRLKTEARLVVEGERESVQFVDAGGNILITAEGTSTDPMSARERVRALKAGAAAVCFKATDASGSGTNTQDRNRTTYQGKDLSKLSPTERLRIGHEIENAK